MKLFPPPWQGTHPAFPETDASDEGTLAWALFAITTGSLASLIRKLPPSGPGRWMSLVGYTTLAGSIAKPWDLSRPEAEEAAKKLLDAKGITMPRRKLARSTDHVTQDDVAVAGAASGFVFGMLRPLRTPAGIQSIHAFARCIGCGTVGFVIGITTGAAWLHSQRMARFKDELQAEIEGAVMYSQTMGVPAPSSLYKCIQLDVMRQATQSSADNSDNTVWTSDSAESSASSTSSTKNPFFGPGLLDAIRASANAHSPPDMTEHIQTIHNQGTDTGLVQCPAGTGPLAAFEGQDGKIVHALRRDFEWRPLNAQEGIETLESHIAEISGKRETSLKTAEFLWHETAKWERRLARARKERSNEDQDDAETRQVRKAVELLNSMHQDQYENIAAMDWAIADLRKAIIQLRNNGEWMPSRTRSFDPQEYRPTVSLDAVKAHEETVISLIAGLEQAVSAGSVDADNEILEAARENRVATRAIIDELEKLVDDPSSYREED